MPSSSSQLLPPLPRHLRSPFVEVVLNADGCHGVVERTLVLLLPAVQALLLVQRCLGARGAGFHAATASGLLGGLFLADAATYFFHYTLDIGGALSGFLFNRGLRALGETFNRVHIPHSEAERAWGGQAQLCLLGAALGALGAAWTSWSLLPTRLGDSALLHAWRVALCTVALVTNFVFEFHRLAHLGLRHIEPRAGALSLGDPVRWLQRARLVLAPWLHREHHATQHAPPCDRPLRCGHWGLVNGWSDAFLDPLFAYDRPSSSAANIAKRLSVRAGEYACPTCTLVQPIAPSQPPPAAGCVAEAAASKPRVFTCSLCGAEANLEGYESFDKKRVVKSE